MIHESSGDVEKAARPSSSHSSSSVHEDTRSDPTQPIKSETGRSHGYDIVSWEGDEDPDCPLNWSAARRWGVIVSVSFAACAVTCCSSMVASTYMGVEAAFGSSREVTTLGLSLFVFGLGLGPMFMAPLSEVYGRRPVYLIGYSTGFIFGFQVAFAQNIQTLLVGRFLTGVAGSAFLSVAGGSVADCFRPAEIAVPMTTFTASVFLGPVLGPVFGSAINYYQDWRVTWYFQLAWSAACLVLLCIFAPETYAPPMLERKARRLRAETGNQNSRAQSEIGRPPLWRLIQISCYRPFELMLTEPMALLLSIWTALYLAVVYAFFSAFDVIYRAHGLNEWEIGLTFWGIGIGTLVGAFTAPIWTHLQHKRAQAEGHPAPPEELLRKGIYGGLIAPFGLIVFAFTCRPTISWAVSVVFSGFFGLGYMLIYMAVFSYLVAAYRPVAASAMALNSFLRSAAAGGLPLGVVQMYDAMGVTWASATIAFVALGMSPIPFIFFRYGERLRRKSKYSPTS